VGSSPLANRWTSREGAALAREAIDRLVRGGRLDALGLASHEGRVDLRGIRFPAPAAGAPRRVGGVPMARLSGTVEVRDQRWEGVDLSHASLRDVKFFDCLLADCRFERADCQRWGFWGTTAAGCSLAGANLRGTAWGPTDPRRPNVLRGCDLREADLRSASVQRVVIEDCDFSQARLDKVTFAQCTIVNCRFAGPLPQVVFDGRDLGKDLQGRDRPGGPEPRSVDFRDAVFELTEFKGYTLDDVTLPDDEQVRLVPRYRAVASRALQLLNGDDTQEARILAAMLSNSLRGPVRDRDAAVFNRRDYLDLMGVGSEALARLATDVIDRARAELS
jgi:uncharacterized protein YjbI with pentapeptide repeats